MIATTAQTAQNVQPVITPPTKDSSTRPQEDATLFLTIMIQVQQWLFLVLILIVVEAHR